MNNKITKAMSKKLKPNMIKTSKIGNRPELTYVPIDKTILFLNDTFGDDWSFEILEEKWKDLPYILTTKTGIEIQGLIPMVSITARLSIASGTGEEDVATFKDGTGADIHKPGQYDLFPSHKVDPDKLCKTAMANALKKATNMFGFALELWDPANVTVTVLNQDSKDKVGIIGKELNLTKEELSGILTEYAPESDGSPLFLADEDDAIEAIAVDAFLTFVKKLASKNAETTNKATKDTTPKV